jgi:hypothetical protein
MSGMALPALILENELFTTKAQSLEVTKADFLRGLMTW